MLCLADWVLIEDFGVFGGLGTDPNSMIPFVLLAAAGYLALAHVPAPATGGRRQRSRWPARLARPAWAGGSLRAVDGDGELCRSVASARSG